MHGISHLFDGILTIIFLTVLQYRMFTTFCGQVRHKGIDDNGISQTQRRDQYEKLLASITISQSTSTVAKGMYI